MVHRELLLEIAGQILIQIPGNMGMVRKVSMISTGVLLHPPRPRPGAPLLAGLSHPFEHDPNPNPNPYPQPQPQQAVVKAAGQDGFKAIWATCVAADCYTGRTLGARSDGRPLPVSEL